MADKVWGGWLFVDHPFATSGGQARCIIRASSRAAVVRAIRAAGISGVTEHFIKQYWSVTGNPNELFITKGMDGVLFVTTGMKGEEFRAVPYEKRRGADRG